MPSDMAPPRSCVSAKAFGVTMLFGALAVCYFAFRTHRDSNSFASEDQARELWDDNQVRCGWDTCTCQWANQDWCSRVDAPRTKCWSCCCYTKFPGSYRWAVAEYNHRHNGHHDDDHHEHNHDDCDHYFPGDNVKVLSKTGLWRTATILNKVDQGYSVKYEFGGGETVSCSRVAWFRPWWTWIMWGLALLCGISLCIGLLLGIQKMNNKPREFDPEPTPFIEPPRDPERRSCHRMCDS